MEAGEHPEQTLEREVTEETGFTAIAQELIGIDSVVIPAARRVTPGAESPLQALRIIYTAQITGGELTYERDGSTDYAAWHDLAAVPGLRPLNLVLTGLELLENHRSPVAAGDNNGSTASDRRGGAGDEASAHAPAV